LQDFYFTPKEDVLAYANENLEIRKFRFVKEPEHFCNSEAWRCNRQKIRGAHGRCQADWARCDREEHKCKGHEPRDRKGNHRN
jgi:hypothetical protein